MNLRSSSQLLLLGALAATLSPRTALAIPASTESLTVKPWVAQASIVQSSTGKPMVLAQANTKTASSSNNLPWILGGGVAIAALTGGAFVLYRLGLQSGEQNAKAGRAAREYKTLIDLAPSAPSTLEEEFYGVRSAQPGAASASGESQPFEPQLSDFDVSQLDAAFADVDDADHMTAAQQVFPIDQPQSTIAVATTAIEQSGIVSSGNPPGSDANAIAVQSVGGMTVRPSAMPVHAPNQVEVQPQQPVNGVHRSVTVTAPSAQPAVSAESPPHTVTVNTTTAQPVAAQDATAIVPSAAKPPQRRDSQLAASTSRPIDGELVTAAPVSGITRQTRLPQVGAVENLLKEIRNPDPAKRRKAIWELGQWGDTRAVQPLVDLMLDADSKQRSLVLSALSEIGTRTLKPMSKALTISLQDENPDVRKNAIRDLTRIYDLVTQISQMVQQTALDDPDEEVRDTANWALKQLNRIRPANIDANMAALSGSVSPPESLPAK